MDESASPKNSFFKNLLSFKTLVTLALLSIFINIAYVQISSSLSPRLRIVERITQALPFVDNKEVKTEDLTCPQACLSEIHQATASSQIQESATTTAALTPAPESTQAIAVAKEFFVPFGSGSSQAADWEDIPGVAATINTDNYSSLKTVTFEATVRIPNGSQTAYVRLYNATDKSVISKSEMSWEGGTTQLLISDPLNLPTGNKTYKVQIKTQLKVLTIFDQARLHIITN